nr:hypothetical protein CTI12_AA065890 [Tanacetum cinerariifolium]GEX18539.1 hypothetical protein CTI12_AA065890 [Tanacetum cinerariifolium]
MSQQNTHPFGDDNADRIIPGPAGILQLAQLCKTSEIKEGGYNGEMLTHEYVSKITEEASEDDHFTRGPWLSAVQYLAAEGGIATGCFGDMKTFIRNGKHEKVVVVIKSCTPNMLGDLTVTLKVLSNQIPFFVLEDLFRCTISFIEPNLSLVKLVLVFLEDINPFTEWNLLANIPVGDTNHDHILGLLHKCYQPMDDAAETSQPDRKRL